MFSLVAIVGPSEGWENDHREVNSSRYLANPQTLERISPVIDQILGNMFFFNKWKRFFRPLSFPDEAVSAPDFFNDNTLA